MSWQWNTYGTNGGYSMTSAVSSPAVPVGIAYDVVQNNTNNAAKIYLPPGLPAGNYIFSVSLENSSGGSGNPNSYRAFILNYVRWTNGVGAVNATSMGGNGTYNATNNGGTLSSFYISCPESTSYIVTASLMCLTRVNQV